MKIKETIGIDVSKLTLDLTIHSTKAHLKCANTLQGYKQLLKWVSTNSNYDKENTLYIFEHTGLYSHQLSLYLSSTRYSFFNYTRLRNQKIFRSHSDSIQKLQRLLSLRDRLVKQNAGHKAYLKEIKLILIQKENLILFAETKKSINNLNKSIIRIEQELKRIIAGNIELAKTYKLLISIKGVGPQVAMFTLVYTVNFTKFKTSRQFASYCGVAPFPNSSGTSIRGRTKISNLANKKLKSLLDMSAKAAIQYNLEMKIFYERRLEMGKSKMSTINIIRNKLIARMFAVVKRQAPYVDLMKYAA